MFMPRKGGFYALFNLSKKRNSNKICFDYIIFLCFFNVQLHIKQ